MLVTRTAVANGADPVQQQAASDANAVQDACKDLGDYPEAERHLGPSGQVIDLDWLSIHGQEGSDCPFPCRYFGEELPADGTKPTDFWRREDEG
jgi:hypothetical protein